MSAHSAHSWLVKTLSCSFLSGPRVGLSSPVRMGTAGAPKNPEPWLGCVGRQETDGQAGQGGGILGPGGTTTSQKGARNPQRKMT